MGWKVVFDDAFAEEFALLGPEIRKAVLVGLRALAIEGPGLGRPWVDTLKGSSFPNMKELRLTVDKVEWRVAFAFDRARAAIVLAAITKGGRSDARTYGRLIRVADRRFADHLRS